MAFNLPRDEIVPVHSIDIRLASAPHQFETRHSVLIERNWREETAANPALFNGEVVLLSSLEYEAGRLAGLCHVIRFATFLFWRKSEPAGSAEHAFACAMPVTSDNALILARMGAHTANAGKVYFAGGSFEPQDFRDRRADPDRNIAREVREEIGVDLVASRRDPVYHLRSSAGATVLFRRFYIDARADALAEAIRAFVAREAVPEIAAPVVVRRRDALPEGVLPHVPPMIDWHFATAANAELPRSGEAAGG